MGAFRRVSKENYAALALEFASLNGSELYLIDDDGRAVWRAWLAYLERLGVDTAFNRAQGRLCAPALWPSDFDINAKPHRAAGARPVEARAARRKQTDGMLQALAREAEGWRESTRQIGWARRTAPTDEFY